MRPSTPRRAAIMLLTYNHARTVQEAAQACLAQEGEPLDIVFSDDGSQDNTFEILQGLTRAYVGPHNVRVRRNPVNLGIGAHVNAIVAEQHNALFICAAGDDISFTQRAREILAIWDRYHQAPDLISSHCISIDAAGRQGRHISTASLDHITPAAWMASRPYVVGATHAFTRRLHEHFGPFRSDLVGEDQAIAFRAACLGGAVTIDKPLVYYREGGISGRPAAPSAAQQRIWLMRSSQYARADLLQVAADARRAGQEHLLDDRFYRELSKAEFLYMTVRQQSFSAKLQVLFNHPDLAWGWRLKKIGMLQFLSAYTLFQNLNRRRLGRRHGAMS